MNVFCHAPPTASAEHEAVWRASLAPYYKEFGIDVDNIPAGPGRMPFSAEAADVLSEFRPAVVSFHFGLPSAELLARVRAWGAKILSSATTVEEARWLEAGGHRGIFLSDDLSTQVGTFALLPQIGRAVRLPVIAARDIVNRIMNELGPIGPAPPAFPLATSPIAPLRAKAESLGSGDFSPLWSGQNASGCKEVSATTPSPPSGITKQVAPAITQRQIAGQVLQQCMHPPIPSIERMSPGKPSAACSCTVALIALPHQAQLRGMQHGDFVPDGSVEGAVQGVTCGPSARITGGKLPCVAG